jgi:flagellar FliJ protein
MARFTFRLEPLLKLRQSRRDECRAALAEAYRVDEVLRKQFDGLERELAALREYCRQKSTPGGVDIDRLVEAQRYELVTRAQQQSIAQQRETVAAEIERRRQALMEADREVRVLEKLRERQAEQHRREEELREAKRLDEVATQQTYRNMLLSREADTPSPQLSSILSRATGGRGGLVEAEAAT